ncbi:flagellin [Acetobacteraceae bacterium KSS8]|uniref:Flagellin n=1 Tax=Endosaccharibacter trunci TaxID=2812733 RepID=A0ABT1W6H8_9PROT|nr:flagellin [Acetobacteraceae bacterium KSS8]
MAFSINTNTASMAALASLRSTNAMLTTTENQISTGKKVNGASDDPAIYAISQTMNSQISALAGVSTGLQTASQVVSMASTQGATISNLLSTLSQSLTEGQTGNLDAATMNDTINKTLSQIDAAANGATFKGANLLAGAVGNGVTSTEATAAQDVNGTLFTQTGYNATSAGLGLSGLNVNQTGLDVSIGTAGLATGDSLKLQTSSVATNTGSATNQANSLTFEVASAPGDAGETALTTAINAKANTQGSGGSATKAFTFAFNGTTMGGKPTVTIGAGFTATSSVDSNGMTNMVITNNTTGAAQTLSYGQDANGNMSVSVSTGADQNGNITAKSTFVEVATKSTDSASTTANKLMAAVQNQGFGVSKDSTTGDLQIAGGNLDSANGAAVTVASDANATATNTSGSTYALLAVNAAITSMNKISSALGSSTNQLTGLQSTVSSLSDALTTGEGALTDADLSAESAKLTSLQTKQQLAIQSLSIANSQSSSLMSLFR